MLKPGSRIALYEYDYQDLSTVSKDLRILIDKVNKYAVILINTRFNKGVLETMFKEASFKDIILEDLFVNIWPMLRLFFIIIIILYLFIRLLGLKA